MRGKNGLLAQKPEKFHRKKKSPRRKDGKKNSGTERDARNINREARKEDVTSRQRARRRINNIGRDAAKKKENNKWASDAREREREKTSDSFDVVSLFTFCAKRDRSGCSAQFPLHARVKRAETLFAITRHATLTKSAALLNRERRE